MHILFIYLFQPSHFFRAVIVGKSLRLAVLLPAYVPFLTVIRCGLSAVLQKPSAPSHFLCTTLHADWVTVSVTEWLIDLSGDRERGCAEGERENVWQLAVNDPRSSSLSIQTLASAPHPLFFQGSLLIIAESHSAAGENKHCFIYPSRFVNEALWTTLWISAQCDRWERGSSLILFSEMICKTPFFLTSLSQSVRSHHQQDFHHFVDIKV